MSVVVTAGARRVRCLALALALVSATGLAGQQTPPAPAQPTFRLDANFVRVDMYPTIDGRPVTDLTRDEIEIREDGVPQAIDTVEYVALSRANRIRVEVPSFDGTAPTAASLLDRAGKPLALEVATGTRVDGTQTWSTGELALAALAAGDYVFTLTVAGPDGPVDVHTGIRVTQ